ncbi:histidine kinase [Flavobacterium sp. PL12]|uniref:sensor histidine kinase n=1 Tax=Flavobacterium sp. PL12 TaxID=3071718 RepID=UPI00319D9CAD
MQLRIRILVALFLFVNFGFAQYFPSKNYTTADGLPNNAVRTLFFDSKNVLWVGTENGVSRMENGSFYNIDASSGLGHNSCWDISQDKKGNMWFASYGGGVTKYNGTSFKVFTTKNGLKHNKTRKLFPFKNNVYVGTEQGVSIIDINSNKVITPEIPKHNEDFICISFFEYRDEVFFTSLFHGLFKIKEVDGAFKIISVNANKNSYSLGIFGSILYSGNEGFIDRYDIRELNKRNFTSTKFGNSIVWQFAGDKRKNIYAAAWGIYNPDGGLYRIENDVMINVSKYYGIDSKIILNVVYDKAKDILYVGSNDKGIYEVRLDKMIEYYSFEDKSIIDFEKIGNQTIILDNAGLTVLNNNQIISKRLTLSDFKTAQLSFLEKQKSIYRNRGVNSLDYKLNFNIPATEIGFYEIVRKEDRLWIGSNIGVFEMDGSGNFISYLPKHTLKFGFGTDGQFIETIPYAGVRVYDDVSKLQAKNYYNLDKNTPQFIVKILNSNSKTYLLSVFNGLYTFENGKFKSYLAEGIWKEEKFKHITVDDKGRLILGAEFGDIFIVEDNPSFKVVKTIFKNQIIGNTILYLEAYKDCILIGTEKGMNVYQNGIVRIIDKEQGLADAAVTTSKIFSDKLWLGTNKGYFVVDLKKVLREQTTVSSIAISEIAINGVKIGKGKYNWFQYSSDELKTAYNYNSFSINFIPKGHPFPEKLQFKYRLENTNRWSPYSKEPNIYLSYLPPGSYNVQIEVFDSNAGKHSVFKLLNIKVLPPFWLTWWFLTISFFVLNAGIFYIFLLYKRKEKEKARVEKRIAETQADVLLNQMNPHFMFNSINTIQHFIISNEVDSSLDFVSNLSTLMRQTFENSLQNKISISDEINYLKAYSEIENIRFGNNIVIEFEIDSAIDLESCKIPTMTLQPFVENVFVHAFNDNSVKPKLIISFSMLSKSILECKIIDNGKGNSSFDKVKLHKSKGVELTKERLILLQKEIKNPIETEYNDTKGTCVTIKIKV